MGEAAFQDLFIEDDASAIDAAQATRQVLIDTQERMGMMLDIMPMGLLIHTEQGILFANQQACSMLQTPNDQIVGQHLLDFIDPGETEAVSAQLRASFRSADTMQSRESVLSGARGQRIDIKLISSRLPWQGTPVVQVLLQDVSDLKRKEERLRQLSVTDELTGAFNRRHVLNEAEFHLMGAGTPGFAFSVILMDIDHFKHVNDTFGHAAGDLALVALSRTCDAALANHFPGGEAVFSRLGGEEFLVILPGHPLDRARTIAEDLRRAVASLRIDTAQRPFSFTISMGVAEFSQGDMGIDGLLSRADRLLYKAKRDGRNRVVAA
ncbi:MAG TPA: sensor domain-containing diguanylate cyclase [Devosiaceae bacterium]